MHRLALTTCSFCLRHTQIAKGRWRLTHTRLPLLRRSDGPTGTRWIRTRRRFKIEVKLRDWIGQHIYVTGDYEPAIVNLIGSLASEGDIVVDAGANIGFHTLTLSRRAVPSGKVIALEPIPSTCAGLRRTLAANGVVNAEVHEIALSDRPHIVVEVSRKYLRQLGFSKVSLCSMLLVLGYRIPDITAGRPLPMRWDPTGWPDQFNPLFSVEAL
jgi:hypothetical protein